MKQLTTIQFELTPQDIKSLVKEAIIEHENEKNNNEALTKIYSFNQVKDILHCSHTTVKKLVNDGSLKTTKDQRKIPAWAVNEYLNNKK